MLVSITARAQRGNDTVTNSLDDLYSTHNAPINYNYYETCNTHNYSNNWDFDLDGKKDSLYFIGTGGAHLYYYLKIVLSSDNQPREFSFIETDFPVFTHIDSYDVQISRGFAILPLENGQGLSIIIRLDDQSYYANKRQLLKQNLTSRVIMIYFENGEPKYICL